MSSKNVMENESMVRRLDSFNKSNQLSLGELILKLKHIKCQSFPIRFDNSKYYPTDVMSWAGINRELSIGYEEGVSPFRCSDFLKTLEKALGSSFEGLRSFDGHVNNYIMYRSSPVWVSNYGEVQGWSKNKAVGVVDVEEDDFFIVLKTEEMTPFNHDQF